MSTFGNLCNVIIALVPFPSPLDSISRVPLWAKKMIEAHQGSIKAESPGEGKGSTFSVELEPFAKA